MEALHHGAEGNACEQQPVYQQGGIICVPLARVWSCPRVQALCGSLQRLREKLLEDERVRMSADGSALNLPADDDDDNVEEEEEEEEEENQQNVKAVSGAVNNMEEDWDRELGSYGDE